MKNPPVKVETKAMDSSFSTFMFGLTVGIVGSLLLGTKEGRVITKKVLKSVSEGVEENEDLFQEAKHIAREVFHQVESHFKTPESFPDQTNESPPPPPPLTGHRRPQAPTYFEQDGTPLKP